MYEGKGMPADHILGIVTWADPEEVSYICTMIVPVQDSMYKGITWKVNNVRVQRLSRFFSKQEVEIDLPLYSHEELLPIPSFGTIFFHIFMNLKCFKFDFRRRKKS